MRATITIPRAYPELLALVEGDDKCSLCECAVGAGADVALRAWLIGRFLQATEGSYVWIDPRPETSRAMVRRIAEQVPGMEALDKRGLCWARASCDSLLWIVSPSELETIPDPIQDVVVWDAQETPDLSAFLGLRSVGMWRVAGRRDVEPASWFDRALHATPHGVTLKRVTAEDAIRGGRVDADSAKLTRAMVGETSWHRDFSLTRDLTRAATGKRLPTLRFARERLVIKEKDSTVRPFILNPVQRAIEAAKRLARKQHKKPHFLVLKYRRGGITTYEQGCSYQLCAEQSNQDCVTLAHTDASTRRIFKIAKLMHDRDPKAPALRASGNERKLDFAALNSTFFIGTAGGHGFGRGDTLQRVHGSEVSKWGKGPRKIEQQRDLLAGLTEAASHGEIVLETTPYGHEMFHELWVEAKQGANDWIPLFFAWWVDPTNMLPCDRDEVKSTLTDDEKALVERHHLSLEQVAWRRSKRRQLKSLFRQEYPEDPESCFLMAGTPFFDGDLVLDLIEKATPPLERKHIAGGHVTTWEKPQPNVRYVLGADTSEGIAGGDPNGLGIMRADNGKQVLSVHGLFRPDVLAEHVLTWAIAYNDALVGIEIENHGHSVMTSFRAKAPPRYRNDHYLGGKLYHHGPRNSCKPGWSTNAVTRPVMLDDLASWLEVEDAGSRAKDTEFLHECLSFCKQHNGKFAANPGCFDDSVMKWAITNQMRSVRVPKPGFSN